ncbi:18879_t:CDS:2, partial [Acaulospora morrowiae]
MRSCLSKSLSEDFEKYLEFGYGYDVKIYVGEYHDRRIFNAHSIVLAARSPYFRSIIEATSQSRGNMIEFHKPKISPNVFWPLLRFLYTGALDIFDANKSLSDPDLTFELILAANELELTELVIYLLNILVNDRAEWLYDHIERIYEQSFIHPSLKILNDYYEGVFENNIELKFQSKNFSRIPINEVILLMSNDNLSVDEIEVWKHIVRWCVAQFSNLPKDPEHWSQKQCNDLRSMMEKLVRVIRWPYISGDEFTTNVIPYAKILPGKLYTKLAKYYVNPSENPIFLNSPKRIRKLQSKLVSTKHTNLISQWIRVQGTGFISQQTKYHTSKIQHNYNLLIRGSRDGFGKSDFQRACQNKGPTIALFKLEGLDSIVGGYNPFSWSTSNKHSAHMQRSFIFAFDNDHDNSIETGKLSKSKNYKTGPIVSITNEGFKFGLDLTLKFADSRDQTKPTLNYCNVEYTLLDNIQRKINNPMHIEDYEIFSIHNISTFSSFSSLKRIFGYFMLLLQNSYMLIFENFQRFKKHLLKFHVLREKFITKFFLEHNTLEIIYGILESMNTFIKSNGPSIERWWNANFNYLKVFMLVFSRFFIIHICYLVLWYTGHSILHSGYEIGWLLSIWIWIINIVRIIATVLLIANTIAKFLPRLYDDIKRNADIFVAFVVLYIGYIILLYVGYLLFYYKYKRFDNTKGDWLIWTWNRTIDVSWALSNFLLVMRKFPGLYNYGKFFIAKNDTYIKRWWTENNYFLRNFLLVPFVVFRVCYLALWYFGYFSFHSRYKNISGKSDTIKDGWLLRTWIWLIDIGWIFAKIWLTIGIVSKFLPALYDYSLEKNVSTIKKCVNTNSSYLMNILSIPFSRFIAFRIIYCISWDLGYFLLSTKQENE